MNLKQQIRKSILFIISAVLTPVFTPFKYLVRKRNVVVMQAHSYQVYCDNTRYLYEFLSNKENVDVYWVTNNAEIKKYISDNGWKYITWHKPFHMLQIAIITKVVIDNGTSFFNIFNILNSRLVTKITLQHGCGPKVTLRYSENSVITIGQINDMMKFDYVNFPSNYSVERMGKNMYFLPDDKVMSLGYPRCDQFFDKERVDRCLQEKSIAKKLDSNFSDKDKVILYTPTWRPYPYEAIPLSLMNGLDAQEFNNWLSDNDLFFFCTVHPEARGTSWQERLDRVVFIDKVLHPLFDINEFMMEVDLLLNDYSTTSTDFSILGRPQLFYMPDYDLYSAKKGFFEDYKNILPGKEVFTYADLKKEIKIIFSDEKPYNSDFSCERKELLQKYYDSKSGNSCDRSYEFVMERLNIVE